MFDCSTRKIRGFSELFQRFSRGLFWSTFFVYIYVRCKEWPNSEDNSEKYPDLKDVVKRARCNDLVSCVLDAVVVAFDREKKSLLSFQVLSTRMRKVEDGNGNNQKVRASVRFL